MNKFWTTGAKRIPSSTLTMVCERAARSLWHERALHKIAGISAITSTPVPSAAAAAAAAAAAKSWPKALPTPTALRLLRCRCHHRLGSQVIRWMTHSQSTRFLPASPFREAVLVDPPALSTHWYAKVHDMAKDLNAPLGKFIETWINLHDNDLHTHISSHPQLHLLASTEGLTFPKLEH
mmetsp:Transcript_20097/g.53921  ORF Transcript_20097/g.53921 Transcript_20097/m.53921 type:complete len:179 (+) Transcript_20097:101-637(+)